MVRAPLAIPLPRAATIKAEYSKLQGKKAQPKPSTQAAR
jgi:hypothetical protein